MNSILAGLVAITAPCNNVTYLSACAIGLVGGLVYILSTKFMNKAKIDDPIQASQVHGFCGFWGVLSVGIFDRDTGLIYTGSLRQLQVQLIGALAMTAWVVIFCTFFFKVMQSVKRLRVTAVYEIIGIDLLMHASIHDFSMDHFLKTREKEINNPEDSERSEDQTRNGSVMTNDTAIHTARSNHSSISHRSTITSETQHY